MILKLKKITNCLLVIVLFIFVSGCSDNNENDQSKPEVVKAFKIEKKKNIADTKETQVDNSASPVDETEISNQDEINSEKEIVKNSYSTDDSESEMEKKNKSESDQSMSGDQKENIPAEPVEISQKELASTDATLDLEAIPLDGEVNISDGYNSEGRIDPFAPLFQPSTEILVQTGDRPRSIRDIRKGKGRLTPLEKLDLSQLKLTGILKLPTTGRNMGMVEEATGKGHVIKKGSYIGVNSGRVVEIKTDKVVIEEEVENYMGDLVVRKRELKLQKPLGER